MVTESARYPARLEIDYPDQLDRMTTFFRLIWVAPIAVIWALLSATSTETATVITDTGKIVSEATKSGGGIGTGLFVATMLMIVFRQRYPRWWFDFARELARFGARIGAYVALLTDRYPSTVEEQSVHLEFDYPDVQRNLDRWLPLVKWFLAIPHYVVLAVLWAVAVVLVVVAWFAIVFTGTYPRGLFDFVVGVFRWTFRVQAYAFLLLTDDYPPFRLE